MRVSKLQFAASFGFLLLAGMLAQNALAQRGRRLVPVAQKAGQNKPAEKKNPPAAQGQPNARGMMGLPPKWVERVREMPPEDQERFMRNNAHFKSLPPERQAQIRENLRRWNQLSPAQRNVIRERERVWEQLTPEQREYVRTQLLPKWQQLPQDRRQLILNRLGALRNLSPAERESRLNDENFMQGLDPNERQMLRDLSNLRLPAP